VCKNDDRHAVFQMRDILLHPFELFAAQRAQSTGLQVHHIHQPDEVHAFLVKAVPPSPLGRFSVSLEIRLPVIVQHIVFAGHKEHVLRAGAFQNLVYVVELFLFRKVADVVEGIFGGPMDFSLDPRVEIIVAGGCFAQRSSRAVERSR